MKHNGLYKTRNIYTPYLKHRSPLKRGGRTTRTNCRLATLKHRRTQKSQWHHRNVNCHTYVISNVLSSVVWAGGKICTQNSSLRQVRQMFTVASPANVHFGKSGKCSLWQVWQMFTLASPGNSPNTSCKHCMRTTGAQEHPWVASCCSCRAAEIARSRPIWCIQ